jgi:hypothetical protein
MLLCAPERPDAQPGGSARRQRIVEAACAMHPALSSVILAEARTHPTPPSSSRRRGPIGLFRHRAAFFLAPPGQQIGQTPAPRYLCPRLQVLQPLAVGLFAVLFPVAMLPSSAPGRYAVAHHLKSQRSAEPGRFARASRNQCAVRRSDLHHLAPAGPTSFRTGP